MSEILTKSRARNVFYGGSIFFVVVFVALTAQSHRYIVKTSTAGMPRATVVRVSAASAALLASSWGTMPRV